MKLPMSEAALWYALSSLFSWPSLPLNTLPPLIYYLMCDCHIIDMLLNFVWVPVVVSKTCGFPSAEYSFTPTHVHTMVGKSV